MPIGRPITIGFWLDPVTGEQVWPQSDDYEFDDRPPGRWHKAYGYVVALHFTTTGDDWPELNEWHTTQAAKLAFERIYEGFDVDLGSWPPYGMKKWPGIPAPPGFGRSITEEINGAMKDFCKALDRQLYSKSVVSVKAQPKLGFWR